MARFYLVENQQLVGPLGESEVQERARTGRATPHTYCWPEGATAWAPLGRVVSGLFGAAQALAPAAAPSPAPPPIPALPPISTAPRSMPPPLPPAPGLPQKVFLLEGDQQVGPLSPQELQQRVREKRLFPNTLCWFDGQRDWAPLKKALPNLFT